jgi:hypothetical protein
MKWMSFRLVVPVVALALASCAHWSDAQKAKLSTVALREPVVKADALKPVDGTESPEASSKVPMATGGGALPALIGLAIDAGVTSYQSNQFQKQYGTQLEQVNAAAPRSLGKKLRARTATLLQRDSFFGSRMRDQSPSAFQLDVLSYGFKRLHRTNDETHLGATMTVKVSLTGSDQKALINRVIVGQSSSSVPVRQLAGKPKQAEALMDEAVESFAQQLQADLDSHLKR